jgi:hypothetical protein
MLIRLRGSVDFNGADKRLIAMRKGGTHFGCSSYNQSAAAAVRCPATSSTHAVPISLEICENTARLKG